MWVTAGLCLCLLYFRFKTIFSSFLRVANIRFFSWQSVLTYSDVTILFHFIYVSIPFSSSCSYPFIYWLDIAHLSNILISHTISPCSSQSFHFRGFTYLFLRASQTQRQAWTPMLREKRCNLRSMCFAQTNARHTNGISSLYSKHRSRHKIYIIVFHQNYFLELSLRVRIMVSYFHWTHTLLQHALHLVYHFLPSCKHCTIKWSPYRQCVCSFDLVFDGIYILLKLFVLSSWNSLVILNNTGSITTHFCFKRCTNLPCKYFRNFWFSETSFMERIRHSV